MGARRVWPKEGITRIPYWIDSDPEVYAREEERMFCQRHLGNASDFICPYHQWTYDLKGNLLGVPFRRGVKKQGGMPADFDPRNGAIS
jgi:Rieske 2Fe-2S protein